ncbi:ubiquitin carboxyl-terminal hydrolase 8 [Aplysia californica]|uniref:ubiquitinyl hydrolase 1 n=1 Tax=Aplysia californica TaxID=6500 RepID=A0ABM0ZYR9_APLCA|nr:ubiquitin carboxyl-terminal hydrolase 8 [Aplysia californica]
MPGKALKKKDLYLGKCMDDLHKLSEVKPLGNNVNIIIRSAAKVFKDAESFDGQNDEERSFVMYIKYFNILKQVKSKPDYKKQKDYFDNLIGKKNQLTAIERAEVLADSLKERYDLKEAEAVAKKLASLDTNSDAKNGGEEKKNEITAAPEVKENGKPAESEPAPTPGLIKCTDLCKLLRDSEVQLILMDVRPASDFAQSHISHTDCISVPEEIIVPGSTVNRMQGNLPSESKEVWMKRKHADHIILFDWKSTLNSVTVGTPLKTLKDALFKFDTSTIIKSEPLVLEGGYEQWLLFYPTMTTNAHVVKPSDLHREKNPSPTATLDFDYPELDENLQKIVPSKGKLQPDSMPTDQSTHIDNGAPLANETHPPSSAQPAAPKFDRTLKPSRSGELALNNTTALPRQGTLSPSSSSEFTSGGELNNSSQSSKANTSSSLSSGLYPRVLYEKNSDMKVNNKNINILNNDLSRNDLKSSNLDVDLKESMLQRGKKETELRDFQQQKDKTLREDDQRLREAEQKLKNLEEMRKKEQKDVADLMRMKRKLTEEIDVEKRRQEEDQQRLAEEEVTRTQALEAARQEEEEKRQRMREVEKLREERKKNEQQKEEERMQQEEEQRKQLAATREAKLQTEQLEREREMEEKEEEKKRILDEVEAKRLERLRVEEEQKKAEDAIQEKLRRQKEAEEVARQEVEREAAERRQREQERQRKEREAREKREIEERARERERKRKEQEDRQREEERKKKEELQRDEKAKIAGQIAGATNGQSKSVPSTYLPKGWEKRLDFSTNRYFYIDHNKGLTQWTPPSMPADMKGASVYTTQLKDEPSVSSSRGLSRSHSSPNIMKELADEEKARRALPGVDRGSKPSISNSQGLSKQIVYQKKAPDLNPVYGNVGPALTGLRNLGNTCYMNSTVQCLNNTTPLVTYFVNDYHLADVNRENSQGMHGEVVDDFAAVIKALWSQQYRSITPRDLKNTVGKYNPMFAGYQQQDSQEFLTFLLDGLHEGLNEVKKAPQIPEQNNENLPDHQAAETAWKHHRMLHRSVIVELFQGQLKSTLMCRTCRKTSVTFQAFMFLSLPIPASNRCSLKECIREFLKPEMMTGSSKWKCPRCKVERDSEKKIDIWKLPPILLIGLNRFYSEGMWMQKKTTYVDFPTQELDLSDAVIGPKPRKAFNLYGVSNHYGTMEGGHYTACCRNPVNKKWHKFDDQDVYEISASDVKTSAAFVLYYSSIELQEPKYKMSA